MSQAPKVNSATIAPKLAFKKIGRFELSGLAVALLAGILAGLLMLLPVVYWYRLEQATAPLRNKRDYAHDTSTATLTADWNVYQSLKGKNSMLGPFSPVSWSQHAFKDNLVSAGDNILDGYRTSSSTRLSDFDFAPRPPMSEVRA